GVAGKLRGGFRGEHGGEEWSVARTDIYVCPADRREHHV
ncbi:MAG: hypothetical protein AVDCRST_MAG78-2502, partial [uncultured Rubrobacteraceae bacterium]